MHTFSGVLDTGFWIIDLNVSADVSVLAFRIELLEGAAEEPL